MNFTTIKGFSDVLNMPLLRLGQAEITLGGIGVGILVMTAAFFVSKVARKAVALKVDGQEGTPSGTSYAFQKIVHYGILLVALFVAFQSAGLSFSSFAVLFGFLSVGVGFGLQNITSNFISSIILLFERPVSVGDLITIESGGDGTLGTVQRIGLRSTVVQTFDRVSIIVPNSAFIENKVINWSHGDLTTRLRVPVGVAYGSDIDKVKRVLLSVANKAEGILKDPAPDVYFLEFADSSLNFVLMVWISQPDKRLSTRSRLNFAIDKAFCEADIKIPFPQRDIHLQMSPAVEKLGRS